MVVFLVLVAALTVSTVAVVFWMSQAPRIEEHEEAAEDVETETSELAANVHSNPS